MCASQRDPIFTRASSLDGIRKLFQELSHVCRLILIARDVCASYRDSSKLHKNISHVSSTSCKNFHLFPSFDSILVTLVLLIVFFSQIILFPLNK